MGYCKSKSATVVVHLANQYPTIAKSRYLRTNAFQFSCSTTGRWFSMPARYPLARRATHKTERPVNPRCAAFQANSADVCSNRLWPESNSRAFNTKNTKTRYCKRHGWHWSLTNLSIPYRSFIVFKPFFVERIDLCYTITW